MTEAALAGPDRPASSGETGSWGVDLDPRVVGVPSSEGTGQQDFQQKGGETEAHRGA